MVRAGLATVGAKTMKTLAEKIAVMQHVADGGKVTCSVGDTLLVAGIQQPSWDWERYDYDIYVEPKPKVKTWPALTKEEGCNPCVSRTLFPDESAAKSYFGDTFVRLVTEYPAVEVEVDDDED